MPVPNIAPANKFAIEAEKRYWLYPPSLRPSRDFGVAGIALGRDLVSGQVDVRGTQLEEVVE